MDEKNLKFKQFLEDENKDEALLFALELLESGEKNVIDLYQDILTPSLNQMECKIDDHHICIWKEHVRTAIIRTIVECCYPYVIKQKKKLDQNLAPVVVVLCPPQEYHDIGARMAADFFTLCGYQVVFVGSDTPYQDFYQAIHSIEPDVVAISVSNYFNLVSTKRIICELRQACTKETYIVVGGSAFEGDMEKVNLVGADAYVKSYQDIELIARNEVRK